MQLTTLGVKCVIEKNPSGRWWAMVGDETLLPLNEDGTYGYESESEAAIYAIVRVGEIKKHPFINRIQEVEFIPESPELPRIE